MQQKTKDALIHGGKIALYIIGSAVIPALIAYNTGNVKWMALAPVLNILAGIAKQYGTAPADSNS